MLTAVTIVAGGGWHDRQVMTRPKACFFTFLSGAWLPIAAVGAWLLCAGPSSSPGWHSAYWFAVLPEPLFISLAVLFWSTEQPRLTREKQPNPDFDLRKLY